MIAVLSTILSVSRTFVPDSRIINPYLLEESKISELISCQSDCTLGDDVFHEECLNYNGCENSPYLKDKSYCESDSDCLLDLGCCAQECKGAECINTKFCAVSNEKFIKAHSFSCNGNIICEKNIECKGSFKTACISNICRIVS